MMKMVSGDGIPLRQGAGTGSRLVFGGYRGLRWRNSRSRLSSRSLGIYRRGWRREQFRGPHRESTRQGARPPPLSGPRDTPPVTLHSSIFYIFPKKSPLIFSAFRELLFLYKNNTTVVLLKTTSVRVSSNQIIPKSYKTIVNIA